MKSPIVHALLLAEAVVLTAFTPAVALSLHMRAAQLRQLGARALEFEPSILMSDGFQVRTLTGRTKNIHAELEPGKLSDLFRRIDDPACLERWGCVSSRQAVLRLIDTGEIQIKHQGGWAPVICAEEIAQATGASLRGVEDLVASSDMVPTLSTAHLTEQQRSWLSEGRPLPGLMTLLSSDEGWLLARAADASVADSLPDNLVRPFAYAAALGSPYVRFDCDGVAIAGLPMHLDGKKKAA